MSMLDDVCLSCLVRSVVHASIVGVVSVTLATEVGAGGIRQRLEGRAAL
jgi:hypothetical protein